MRTIFTAAAGLAVITASGSTQGQQTLDTIEGRGGGFLSTTGSMSLGGGETMSLVEMTSAETTDTESQRKKMGLRTSLSKDQIMREQGRRSKSAVRSKGTFQISGNVNTGGTFLEKTSAETTDTESQRKKMALRTSLSKDQIMREQREKK